MKSCRSGCHHRIAVSADEAAVIDFMVAGWRLLSGSAHPFDEVSIRALATQEVQRASNLLSMMNQPS